MTVNATEFQTNLGKYLDLVVYEDILITRNGKTIAKMIHPQTSAVDSLRGLLRDAPASLSRETIKEERLKRYDHHV